MGGKESSKSKGIISSIQLFLMKTYKILVPFSVDARIDGQRVFTGVAISGPSGKTV